MSEDRCRTISCHLALNSVVRPRLGKGCPDGGAAKANRQMAATRREAVFHRVLSPGEPRPRSRRRFRRLFSVVGPPFLRKEVIQPQVPLRLPCYDFTPVTNHSLGACLPCGLAQPLLEQSTPMV